MKDLQNKIDKCVKALMQYENTLSYLHLSQSDQQRMDDAVEDSIDKIMQLEDIVVELKFKSENG